MNFTDECEQKDDGRSLAKLLELPDTSVDFKILSSSMLRMLERKIPASSAFFGT